MKQLVMLGLLVFLVGCSSSGGESDAEGEVYPLRLAMETVNLCDQRTAFSEYEVLVYNSLGELISRHKPNDEGVLDTNLKESRANLMIVRKDYSDDSNLKIIVMTDYPIGDLGVHQIQQWDYNECECSEFDVVLNVEDSSNFSTSFAYSEVLEVDQQVVFKDSKFCKLQNGLYESLVVGKLDSNTNERKSHSIKDPMSEVLNNELFIDFQNLASLGRLLKINTSSVSARETKYQVNEKNTYTYEDYDSNNSFLYMMDSEEITPVEYKAYESIQLEGVNNGWNWSVHFPLTLNSEEVTYEIPSLDYKILDPLVENHEQSYDVSGDTFRMLSGEVYYRLPSGQYDSWSYVMSSKRETPLSLDLPSDLLPTDYTEDTYKDLKYWSGWGLKMIEGVNSLDDIYKSEWINIFLFLRPVNQEVIPPSSYSRIGSSRGFTPSYDCSVYYNC